MIDRVETSTDRVRNKASQNGVIQPLLTGKMVVKDSFIYFIFFCKEDFVSVAVMRVMQKSPLFPSLYFRIDSLKIWNRKGHVCLWYF